MMEKALNCKRVVQLLALAITLLLVVGSPFPSKDAAAAGEAPGCYLGNGVAYYYDSVTWYILVDQGNGTTAWWTWSDYQTQTGAAAPQDLQAVSCWANSYYIHQGYEYYYDGATWTVTAIFTDRGWMSIADYNRLKASVCSWAQSPFEAIVLGHSGLFWDCN